MNQTITTKQVLLRIAGQLFGIPVSCVSEMIQTPTLTQLPHMPPSMRGVFIQRGKTIAAFDLRGVMGMPTLDVEIGEFRAMLEQREQDHRNWILELEASVAEERPFGLATDPRKCAFGRWYDTFETDSVLIASHLRKFEGPHNRIHALAVEVKDLVAEGNVEAARWRIDAVRNGELSEMIALFQQFKVLLDETAREIAIVLRGNDGDGDGIAYCVDSVEGVMDVPLHSMMDETEARSEVPHLTQRGLTATLIGAKRELALLVDEPTLYAPLRTVSQT
ncbi:diguanylate cyclase [Planctomycetes bacterium Poly30]|uniref:Diguanylate cyclase n=1 Tax=Saltatorellus ferox TaxID=2528018 RepID=A0A518EMB4_9BACT|nr:diguanylate cyclase [Planctomycetes bacterium Poly30]